MHLIVSGANGFVGQVLCRILAMNHHRVTALVRTPFQFESAVRPWLAPQNDFLGLAQSWPNEVEVESVIHLAARVHVVTGSKADSIAAYRETNVEGSLRLARAARDAGARRFVYVSSIKALGEIEPGRAWREEDAPQPTDPYGLSKLEAELALKKMGEETGMEIVVVRPPLVYGPFVRANFLSLMRALARGIPLPLGSLKARRSMIYVENLADALLKCATDPRAAGQTFHLSDGEDLPVVDLARKLAHHLHVSARLIPVPMSLLEYAGRLTGRGDQVQRLVSPLRLDIRHIREHLGWITPYSVERGLLVTANWYRSTC